MQTKNTYSRPVDISLVRKVTSESPAHKRICVGKTVYDLTRAVDFICEIETPVKVASDGKISDVFDGVTKNWDKYEVPPENYMSGLEQNGNFVVIEHVNNEYSMYGHLKPGKINYKIGDAVSSGDVLGYVGHTGWSIVPHLHFMVFRFSNPAEHEYHPRERSIESLEIRWKK